VPKTVGAPAVGYGVVSRGELYDRLSRAGRVVVVSASAGSGKTFLLRSWIAGANLTERAAWVSVQGSGHDPQRFWMSVADALRGTAAGSALVRGLTAAPDLDGWAIAERLLKDLAPLDSRLWLVIDDLHELHSPEALRQLELVIMRAAPDLRFVLSSRSDLALRLQRLRLEGEVTEFRTADLRFTLEEAGALFEAAGVQLPAPTLALLHERTEGWVAGLRLAALSLAGHPDPERFAAEFSGSERTVADYLLAEVLDRQSYQARRLLLRTSLLERVSGPLADLLSGGDGGERILQDLEAANAFVVALDAGRSWFRYHHLFAELLQLELRRTEPGEDATLHSAAARWFAEHGYPVEAIRHAEAAQDWTLASVLLADHWPAFHLGGRAATVHALLAAFPPNAHAANPELAAVAAADQLAQGSLETAERYLDLSLRETASVAPGRRGQADLLLGVVRLLLARQRGNLPTVADAVRRLQAMAEALDGTRPGMGEDLHTLALISLGITELRTSRMDDAERHLEQGVALAHRIGRPFLEFSGLAYQAVRDIYGSFTRAAERSRQAIELARQHGWTDEPAAGTACAVLGGVLAWQGRPEEAEPWVQGAERTLRAEAEPAAGKWIYFVRGVLELARGRDAEALAAFTAAERLGGLLAAPHLLTVSTRAQLLHTLVRLGEIQRAEALLAELDEQTRDWGEIQVFAANLQLARHDPHAATVALGPVLDGSAPVYGRLPLIRAYLLEAIARDALGDDNAADGALERALDLTERDGALSLFVQHPAPALLHRHARHRTAHTALVTEILSLMTKVPASAKAATQPLLEPLSQSEIRVLRYLPTHLSMPEIASELYVSLNTVRTHMRHLYTKLGTHRRAETVERARALGLLAPSRPRG
jgi:LuxR family transcriptional regulator, maltose regulon positive regulatory protein